MAALGCYQVLAKVEILALGRQTYLDPVESGLLVVHMDPKLEEDPVIKEVPVYLAGARESQLYLFQYPLRPPDRPYDFSKIKEMKVKPNQQRIQMKFDREIDPLVSQSMNEQGVSRDEPFVLESTLIAPRTSYAVGYLHNGALHLTPLTGIVQMKPHLGYLKGGEVTAAQQTSAGAAASDAAGFQPVQVQFRRRDSERAAQAIRNSYRTMQQRAEEEEWIGLGYHAERSQSSASEKQRLLATKRTPVGWNVNRHDYLKVFAPSMTRRVTVETAEVGQLTRETLRGMPVDEQVKALLMKASNQSELLEYERIRDLVHARDSKEVLSALTRHGLYVQGAWVAQSELVVERHNIPQRDFLLCELALKQEISQKRLLEEGLVDTSQISLLLEPFAKLRAKKWTLREPNLFKSTRFAEQFPQVVAEQAVKQRELQRHAMSVISVRRPAEHRAADFITCPSPALPEPGTLAAGGLARRAALPAGGAGGGGAVSVSGRPDSITMRRDPLQNPLSQDPHYMRSFHGSVLGGGSQAGESGERGPQSFLKGVPVTAIKHEIVAPVPERSPPMLAAASVVEPPRSFGGGAAAGRAAPGAGREDKASAAAAASLATDGGGPDLAGIIGPGGGVFRADDVAELYAAQGGVAEEFPARLRQIAREIRPGEWTLSSTDNEVQDVLRMVVADEFSRADSTKRNRIEALYFEKTGSKPKAAVYQKVIKMYARARGSTWEYAGSAPFSMPMD